MSKILGIPPYPVVSHPQGDGFIFGLNLLALAAGLVLVAKAWPPLSRFYDRIRSDWTLLSFGLYGATLMAVLLTIDDYVQEEPYAANPDV